MNPTPKYHRMFDYDKRLLPNKFLAGLEEGVADIEAAKVRSGFTIGYPGWNFLYYSALCSLDRESENIIVETGTNLGCSTIILAQALLDSRLKGRVHTVELKEENYRRAVENIHQAGVAEVVSTNLGDSIPFLESFVQSVRTIRFAFLDGSHEQKHVLREFEIIDPKLDDRSVVFFDNTYNLTPEDTDHRVNGALKMITKRFGGNLVNFENTSWYTPGQAIWQRYAFRKDWDGPQRANE